MFRKRIRSAGIVSSIAAALLALLLAACDQNVPTPSAPEIEETSTLSVGQPDALASPVQDADPTREEPATPTKPAPETTPVTPSPTRQAEVVSDDIIGASGMNDPFYPLLGNGGYDVQHYTIKLEVDVDTGMIDGTTTIGALATHHLDTFNLDFSGLEVTEISVSNQPADWTREQNEMTVNPPGIIQAGDNFSVTVAYHGIPEPIIDPAVPFLPLGWQAQEDGFFVASEPSGSMNWYPVNNYPTDKATYTLQITVPYPYMVAANGQLVESFSDEVDSTFVWEASDPIASYLVTVHIGRYEVEASRGPNDLPIRNYFYEGTPEEVRQAFAPTAEMIAFMNELIAPYPFEAYGVVLLDHPTTWALETQTLSTFSPGFVGEGVVFHELMHQWYGNSVSLATWQDIWLNEGFASYFTQLWGEHLYGPEWLNDTMGQMHESLVMREIPPPIPDQVERMFASATYSRGAWTLHALRLVVGDEVFFDILRTYYDRYQNGVASTADFIAVAAELGGSQAEDVLLSWLYDPAVPPIP